MSKRPALGRGLASLIPDAEPVNERPITSDGGLSGDRVHSIQVDLIDPGRYQPRTEFHEEALEELTQSIREKGILQPLIARHNGERFELIAGERRLRAARAAGLQHVPLIVRDVSDQESLELALIENIQRNDLNAIELARAFLQLQEDFGYTHEEVSRRVGKDRSGCAEPVERLHHHGPRQSVAWPGRSSASRKGARENPGRRALSS